MKSNNQKRTTTTTKNPAKPTENTPTWGVCVYIHYRTCGENVASENRGVVCAGRDLSESPNSVPVLWAGSSLTRPSCSEPCSQGLVGSGVLRGALPESASGGCKDIYCRHPYCLCSVWPPPFRSVQTSEPWLFQGVSSTGATPFLPCIMFIELVGAGVA